MKKALIILITLLVLAGIFIGLYYFLWTAENFAKLGKDAMAEGDYETAAERYEIAVGLEPDNQEYIMALVQAYASDYNYTKAERTLVKAIRVMPNADLYCKLSELYVLQDKILDSQLMLDTITDPAVRAEVEALRPAAPVFSPEPGSYDEYVDVNISSTDGKIYYSMTADYPSSHSDPFSEPISLGAGKSCLQAIVVGNNGLASPIVEAEYHIVGVVEEVQFESPELEEKIRTDLYIARTSKVMTSDLWGIESLQLSPEITCINDLKYFPDLKELTMESSNVEDYSVFAQMPQLEHLNLGGSLISSEALEYIGQLTNLKTLVLSSCGISGIQSLAGLTSLETLELADNSISDISALSSMTSLQKLDLRSNAVSTLDALKGITTLQHFNGSHNRISTLAPLQGSIHMQTLYLEDNALLSVGSLGHMADLSILVVSGNELEDISALGSCTRMTRLEAANNHLTSVDCIAKMPLLTYLDCSHNQITALPELDPMSHLQQFYASYNQLSSVSSLAGMQELTYVDVDYNEELEDIQVLSTCHLLVQVNAFGTHVKEVKLLTDYGVIVNFDPSYADQDTED